jgi:ABC-2 type transport system ATP-binding protein
VTTSTVIEVDHLTRRFGSVVAVDDVSFDVAPGEVVGFLGPNGAGKSTTLRTLMGFLRPTAGTCRVLGVRPGRDVDVRGRIGYLPGDFRIESGMRPAELFSWFARLRGVPVRRAHELAERLDLDVSRPFGALSKGNRQKVGIVQALLHRPEVLVLDEPSTGLDPGTQRELLGLVRDAAGDGAAVLLSSHVLPEVERVADRVAVLRAARLVAFSRVGDLLDHARHRLELSFTEAVPADLLQAVPGVVAVAADGRRLDIVVDGPVGPALAAAAAHGDLLRVAPVGDELEDLFFAEAAR